MRKNCTSGTVWGVPGNRHSYRRGFGELLMRASALCIALALAAPHGAHAACLLGDYSLNIEYARASAVVIAEAVAERTVPDPEDPEGFAATLYTAKIDESFRGTLRGVIELYSENSSGRFPMDIGKKYILFIYAHEGLLSADNCGNSDPTDERTSVVAAVREMSKVNQRTQKPNQPVHATPDGARDRQR